jgi:putative hydrolase of the HAD superfamily
MLNDIFAASRAGFRTALFAGDRRSLRLRDGDSRVAGVSPDRVIRELKDVIPLLDAGS